MDKTLIKKEFKALGTEINVWLVAYEEEKEKVLESARKLENFYKQKEKIFSRFDLKSELSLLNKNLGKFQKASEDIFSLSERSLVYNEFSQGFFDPRIFDILEKIGYEKDFYSSDFKNKEIKYNFSEKFGELKNDLKMEKRKILFERKMDFSGLAKGYITDKAAELLKNEGHENFLLDSGGDIYVSGKNDKGSDWEVILEGFREDEFSVKVSGKGVATSGITRRKWDSGGKRYHHLINPKNPENFSFELKSVTVIESTTEKADVYAKILFLMGKEKGLEFAEKNDVASIFLDYKGNVFIAKEAEKYINL